MEFFYSCLEKVIVIAYYQVKYNFGCLMEAKIQGILGSSGQTTIQCE